MFNFIYRRKVKDNKFYLTPCTKEAKENMEQVNSLKGKL